MVPLVMRRTKAVRMAHNPDRDFSAGNLPEQEQERLWTLLQRSEVADLVDPGVCERFGRLISRAAFNPVNPGWYSGWAQYLAPNDAPDRAQVQSPKQHALGFPAWLRGRR
jgi:hypothetical protein